MRISLQISFLAMLMAVANHAAAQNFDGWQCPDSVTVRNAKGEVTAKSTFTQVGQAIIRVTTADSLRIVSVLDENGRETSRSVFKGDNLTSRTDFHLTSDGRIADQQTTEMGGRRVMTAFTYNADGHVASEMLSIWDSSEMDWVPAERCDYSYIRQPLPLPQRQFGTRVRSKWDSATDQWVQTDDATSYDYNAQGQLTQQCVSSTAQADACSSFSYDADGRVVLTQTSRFDSHGSTPAQTERRSYDKAGRLSAITTTDANGALISEATYFYPSRAKERHTTARSPRLTKVEVLNADARVIANRTYYYDAQDRVSGMAIDSLGHDGRVTSRHETAYVYSTSGRLAQKVDADIVADSEDLDMPFDSYTITMADEQGNPVMAFDYDPNAPSSPAIRTRQWRNTYDAKGRLTQSVRSEATANGNLERRDSVATAYDVYVRKQAVTADSASVISRTWMRLAGFFSRFHKGSAPDTASVVADDDKYVVETVTCQWAGQWTNASKIQRVYDDEGHVRTEYSYRYVGGSVSEWHLSGKAEHDYDGGRVVKIEKFVPAADKGRFEKVGALKFHYY